MTYNCHRCNCADCRRSYFCDRCKSCNGSGARPGGSCLDKELIEIPPEIAGIAFKTIFNVRDPRKFAKVFLAAEEAR